MLEKSTRSPTSENNFSAFQHSRLDDSVSMIDHSKEKFTAVLDSEQKFVTIVMFGENGGVVRKMQVKVKADQGMMLDNMSQNESIGDFGGTVELRRDSLIYGRRQTHLDRHKKNPVSPPSDFKPNLRRQTINNAPSDSLR